MLDNPRLLTQEQHQPARQAARRSVARSVGPRPVRQ
jgi:hypothetical protein